MTRDGGRKQKAERPRDLGALTFNANQACPRLSVERRREAQSIRLSAGFQQSKSFELMFGGIRVKKRLSPISLKKSYVGFTFSGGLRRFYRGLFPQ